MKRWLSLLLVLIMTIGAGGIAAAEAAPGAAQLQYQGLTYEVSVASVLLDPENGVIITLQTPSEPQAIRFMNGDTEMGMEPGADIWMDLNVEGMPFFSAIEMTLLSGGMFISPSSVRGTKGALEFTFDLQSAPDSILLFTRGSDTSVLLPAPEIMHTGDEIPAPEPSGEDDSSNAEPIAIEPGAMRFTVGGVTYDVILLEDAPAKQSENRLDGLEGHAVHFSYDDAQASEAANMRLYTYTKLITPSEQEIRTYSNYGDRENPYTLYFGLPDGVLLTDCVMRVPGDNGDVLIPLNGGPIRHLDTYSAPAMEVPPEETPAPEPEATADPGEPGETKPRLGLGDAYSPGGKIRLADIDAFLLTLAAETTDPWQQAIYSAGATDLTIEENTAHFMLRAFDPKYSELGNYPGDDPVGWYAQMVENLGAHTVAASVTLTGENTPDADSAKAIQRIVRTAAEAAQAEFNKKAMRLALVDQMFPMPMAKMAAVADLFEQPYNTMFQATEDNWLYWTSAELEELAPLFYAQVSQVLSVKEGPHALTLNCKGVADPAALLDNARAEALEQLTKRYRANEMDGDEINDVLLEKVIEQANAIRKKGGESFSLTIDIDEAMDGYFGDAYTDYLEQYDYYGAWDILTDDVWDLPDEVAQDYPKSGYLSGSRSGTKVIIKTPDDGNARYVQVREVETDEPKVSMFIHSGKQVTVYVPKGMYYLLIGSGESWYGEEGLFGRAGNYSRTDDTEILSSDYYHTITLEAATDGNIDMYGADMSDFF